MKKSADHYKNQYRKGISQFDDLEGCRERLAFIKKRVLNNLDKYLLEFEGKFIRNGGAVYWADTAEDAIRIVQEIIKDQPQLIVKSKSMTTEEVGFNSEMQTRGDEVVETDLGEFIVQQMGQKPSHITAPAIHLSKSQIAGFLSQKFGINPESSAEEITSFVRKLLRNKFTTATVGVSGANFLIADTGSVAITENEGNGSLVTAWPQKHIVLAGIEKIVPSIKDLYLLWPMLASHATGQSLSVYNHIISGPARSGELDGPSEMAVIILNNNRHRLLEDIDLRESLQCVRCGACLTVCPVYRRITGHSYQSVYSGPIGSVIAPHLNPAASLSFLSYASTLCGQCTQQCPAKVPLHRLLVYNRYLTVKNKEAVSTEYRLLRRILKRLKTRKSMDFPGSRVKNIAIKLALRKTLFKNRIPITFAEKSFNRELMVEAEKNKK